MSEYKNLDISQLSQNSAKHVIRALIWGPEFQKAFFEGARIGFQNNIVMRPDSFIVATFNEMYRVNKKGRLVKKMVA
jgi:hypothetical protein